MNAKNLFKTAVFSMAALVAASCAASGVAHDLESSFSGDFGETPVYLKLNNDKTAVASYKDTMSKDGGIKTIGKGSWTYEGDVKTVKTVKIGDVNLEVSPEYGTITMGLAIGDNNGTPTIDCVAEGAFWTVTFKYDKTKPNPAQSQAGEATFTVQKGDHVSSVDVYDFVLGDYSTLATPVTKVVAAEGHFIAVKPTCEAGYEVDKVTFDGAEGMLQAGYYCYNGGGLQAKSYTIVVTAKAAAAA
ncbi:MAG: hypothetical protein MJ228_03535 [Bacilli bacterium]|nr:hypothetical protein [Bacilli bacterium]